MLQVTYLKLPLYRNGNIQLIISARAAQHTYDLK